LDKNISALFQDNSSSSALASFKSAVSNGDIFSPVSPHISCRTELQRDFQTGNRGISSLCPADMFRKERLKDK
jgi:hypothetical protein